MITFAEAKLAQSEIEDRLLADPNVASIGIIAETDAAGKETGGYAISVGVFSVDNYRRASKLGASIELPQVYTLRSDDGKTGIKKVQIKIVADGHANALLTSQPPKLPSAIDDIPADPLQVTTGSQTSRIRPIPCGHSIGHPDTTAGTYGLLVEYTNVKGVFVLSNQHVLAPNNLAFIKDPIIQPGHHDGGKVGKDTFSYLHRWVPLNPSGVNFVDAALARVKGDDNWSKHVVPYVTHIGYPRSAFALPQLGMMVEKTGRTTGHTTGIIEEINLSKKISYGSFGVLIFKGQIRTTIMSKPGDSGSCLFEIGTQKPVGLLFAGGNYGSYHNPIGEVFSSLTRATNNVYPTGKVVKFPATTPLQVVQRRCYSSMVTKRLPTRYASLLPVVGLFALNTRTTTTANKQPVVEQSHNLEARAKSEFAMK